MEIHALIRVTTQNLNPKAYLLANRDVALRGVDPHLHFRKHGEREGRYQLNLHFLDESAEFRRRKFERFAPILDFDVSQATTFPITVSGGLCDISDYDSESACGEHSDLAFEIQSNPEKNYMDLGCGLRHVVRHNCLYVEVYRSLTADLIVPPTCTYPIKDNSLDGIGCFAVLEHTRKPWLVVQEMRRMLKPGGKVWIDWPFLQPVHGYPAHYFNATREGLRSIFEDEGFQTSSIGTGPYQGLDHTLTWSMNELMRKLPLKTRKRISKMSIDAFLAHRPGSAFWKEILSEVDEKTRETLACGNTLIATKQS